MNKIKKFFILVTVVAVLSLSITDCGKKSEKPVVEQSVKKTKSTEHLTSEHPTDKEGSDDHPSDNK